MAAILRKLSEELVVVLLIGLVSTTTAWTAIQASFHNNASSAAYGDYQLIIADANNLWITAEVKYRADLLTWDTGLGGSYEYSVYALSCKERNQVIRPETQLPDCTAYMDAVYGPYNQMYDSGTEPLERSEQEGNYSNRLQVLTGIFAVALFALGVTSPMKSRKNASYLVAFSTLLWAVGVALMATIPIILI
jgi:hypothetical protein